MHQHLNQRRIKRNKPQIEIALACEENAAQTVSNIDSPTAMHEPNFQIFKRH